MARIDIRRGAIPEILKSLEVQADLNRRANAIASTAGPGHRVDSQVGSTRARAAVITDTIAAMVAESRNRSLTSAIDAGRG